MVVSWHLVTRMGFGPMNTALRGRRVKPLHQRAILAASVRFELTIMESESVALPLGHEAIHSYYIIIINDFNNFIDKIKQCFIIIRKRSDTMGHITIDNFYEYSLNEIADMTDSKLKETILQLYYNEIKKIEKDAIGSMFVNPYDSLEQIAYNIDLYLDSLTSNYLFPNDRIKFYPSIKEYKAKKTILCDFSGSLIFTNNYYCIYRPLLQNLDNGKRYVLKRSIKVETSYNEYLPRTFHEFENFIYTLENAYTSPANNDILDYYSIAANIKDWSLLELQNNRTKFHVKKVHR